jgi:hypothetical protein
MPDEPPDAWPACPVVWEGDGRPVPLPDGVLTSYHLASKTWYS